jgi:hypothetical protein
LLRIGVENKAGTGAHSIFGLLTKFLHDPPMHQVGATMAHRIIKTAVAVSVMASVLTAGACSRTQQYMATGGALGAGGGAVVAAATGGSALGGAIIGGALGTGGGYVLSR